MSEAIILEPVVKTLTLKSTPEKAFNHFTKNIHVWWPLASHSISRNEAKTVIFEEGKNARIYEIENSGKEREWGRVLVWEPPHRLVYSWVLEAPENATEVEVNFEDAGGGKTDMTLIHRGWENREEGGLWRGRYDEGWNEVLSGYERSLS